jgi:nitrate reductase gamma subunit
MSAVNISLFILLFAILFAIVGLTIRVARLLAHPAVHDPSPPKASARKGIFYAFTLGMLPWKKESARLHPLVYLRGVLFHIGVFTFIVLLFVSLFVNISHISGRLAFSPFLGLGLIAGVTAMVARFTDRNLRALSRPDDYISLALVTLVLLSGLTFVLNITSRTVFWGFVSVLCLYLPWSKIPHVAYFFFSRTVFGVMFGRRGVLPAAKSELRN